MCCIFHKEIAKVHSQAGCHTSLARCPPIDAVICPVNNWCWCTALWHQGWWTYGENSTIPGFDIHCELQRFFKWASVSYHSESTGKLMNVNFTSESQVSKAGCDLCPVRHAVSNQKLWRLGSLLWDTSSSSSHTGLSDAAVQDIGLGHLLTLC